LVDEAEQREVDEQLVESGELVTVGIHEREIGYLQGERVGIEIDIANAKLATKDLSHLVFSDPTGEPWHQEKTYERV